MLDKYDAKHKAAVYTAFLLLSILNFFNKENQV